MVKIFFPSSGLVKLTISLRGFFLKGRPQRSSTFIIRSPLFLFFKQNTNQPTNTNTPVGKASPLRNSFITKSPTQYRKLPPTHILLSLKTTTENKMLQTYKTALSPPPLPPTRFFYSGPFLTTLAAGSRALSALSLSARSLRTSASLTASLWLLLRSWKAIELVNTSEMGSSATL